MDSILTSVKKMLGIVEGYEHFDVELIMHINSTFTILNQLAVGPPEGFVIASKADNWTDFLPEGKKLEICKSYVYLRTKLLFDPPTAAAAIEAINNQIKEFEWRLNVAAEEK